MRDLDEVEGLQEQRSAFGAGPLPGLADAHYR
jgi:hypothetical protein